MSALARAGHKLGGAAVLAALAGFCISPSVAEPVDVQLVLAVDVSLSMSTAELEIQRHGYSAALTHESVLEAIQGGTYGKVAIAYVEWAGTGMQRVVVPWTVVATRADAESVVAQLGAGLPHSARRTSIAAALEFGGNLFAASRFESTKRVIDISGDGPNNQGEPVDGVRDRLVEQGITINGLPLMTRGEFGSLYDVPDLDRYYSDCVIGGPGAFMVPVNDWTQFPEAIRRKLVMELAGPVPPSRAFEGVAKPLLIPVQDRPKTDCQVGEKMWLNRRFNDGNR